MFSRFQISFGTSGIFNKPFFSFKVFCSNCFNFQYMLLKRAYNFYDHFLKPYCKFQTKTVPGCVRLLSRCMKDASKIGKHVHDLRFSRLQNSTVLSLNAAEKWSSDCWNCLTCRWHACMVFSIKSKNLSEVPVINNVELHCNFQY